jgi:hypothetical protein
LFAGRDVDSREEARQVLLGCENDPKALCFAGLLIDFDAIRPAAELGDAFAQAWMMVCTGEPRFRWAEKSAAQGERDGFFWLGYCYRTGVEHSYRTGAGCVKDAEREKENFLVAAELGASDGFFK